MIKLTSSQTETLNRAASNRYGFIFNVPGATVRSLKALNLIAEVRPAGSTVTMRYITSDGRALIGAPALIGTQPVCADGPSCKFHHA
jgi:hypothetical protein